MTIDLTGGDRLSLVSGAKYRPSGAFHEKKRYSNLCNTGVIQRDWDCIPYGKDGCVEVR